MKVYFLRFFVVALIITFQGCKNSGKVLDEKLFVEYSNTIYKLNKSDLFYIFVFTDYDCSDCNKNYISNLFLSINEENEDAKILLALYDFKPKEDLLYFDDIKSLFDNNSIFFISNFNTIKNTALSAGFPMGPFIIKIDNGKIRYIRKVSQPFK